MGKLPTPPKFATHAEERLHRKQRLAAGFRLFSKFGFDEGVAGHITARDPEFPDTFWVNPFGVHFSQIKVSNLIRCDHKGAVVEGDYPVNTAAFVIHSRVHAARPDAARRRPFPLDLRAGVLDARAPARADHPGRLRLLQRSRAL